MGSEKNNPADEAAPLLGTWGAWYALVLGTLGALVILFTLLGRVYR